MWDPSSLRSSPHCSRSRIPTAKRAAPRSLPSVSTDMRTEILYISVIRFICHPRKRGQFEISKPLRKDIPTLQGMAHFSVVYKRVITPAALRTKIVLRSSYRIGPVKAFLPSLPPNRLCSIAHQRDSCGLPSPSIFRYIPRAHYMDMLRDSRRHAYVLFLHLVQRT